MLRHSALYFLIINPKLKQMESKRAKVHMLPIDKPVIGCISNQKLIGRYLQIVDKYHKIVNPKTNPTYDYYHLYFTSDEEIKAGDWYLHFNKHVFQCEKTINHACEGKLVLSTIELEAFDKDCKKIVATTDESLTQTEFTLMGIGKNWKQKPLPQPPQAFIEKYCKVGDIDEVDIEYEGIETYPNGIWKDAGTMELALISINDLDYPYRDKLKVDPVHNTITIHSIKDSWDRKELKAVLMAYSDSQYGTNKNSAYIEQWIADNL